MLEEIDQLMPVGVIAFVLGAVVGSFLNVVIARLPAGESIVTPRSHCPKCGDMIPSWLNVPILSWLVLRGRCRACKLPISPRYPMVELLTAVLFWACHSRFGLSLALLTGFILAGSLVAITFIDIDTFEIADEISLPGIVLGAILRPLAFEVPWWSGVAGAVVGGGLLWSVRLIWTVYARLRLARAKKLGRSAEEIEEWELKEEGMGFGDVKLLAMIGAFLGAGSVLMVVMVASVAGSLIGGIVLLVAKLRPPPPSPPAVAAEPAPVAAAELAPIAAPEPAAGIGAEPGAAPSLDGAEEDWVPPPTAIPFGPFLALGALTQLLLGPALEGLLFRWVGILF